MKATTRSPGAQGKDCAIQLNPWEVLVHSATSSVSAPSNRAAWARVSSTKPIQSGKPALPRRVWSVRCSKTAARVRCGSNEAAAWSR